jgi:hypothetical protein
MGSMARSGGAFTIAASGTESNELDLSDGVLVALQMPGTWTAADITFKARPDGYGTARAVKRGDGSVTPIAALTIKDPAANDYIVLNPADTAGLKHVTLVSSASQAAERIVKVVVRPVG